MHHKHVITFEEIKRRIIQTMSDTPKLKSSKSETSTRLVQPENPNGNIPPMKITTKKDDFGYSYQYVNQVFDDPTDLPRLTAVGHTLHKQKFYIYKDGYARAVTSNSGFIVAPQWYKNGELRLARRFQSSVFLCQCPVSLSLAQTV